VIEHRNVGIVAADILPDVEGNTDPLKWLSGKEPPVSESRACSYKGFPGTWEARPSPPKGKGTGMELPAAKAPGPVLSCLTVPEANHRHSGGTAKRRQGAGRMEGRESESLIVPMKTGNRLDGTRWREGAANHQNCTRAT